MHQQIKKWGNGAAVRIPKSIMEQAHLSLDSTVDIRVENGCVVVEPTRKRTYNLDELVQGITDENRHDEVSTGDSVGNEAF